MKFKHLILILLFLFANDLWAQSSDEKSLFPVIINGHQLPSLLGQDINTVRVYSFSHGQLRPIPFQIDQKDSNNNWVWQVSGNHETEPVNRFDDQDPKGQSVFDQNDQLVFMAWDLGEQLESISSAINADHVQELAVFLEQSSEPVGWLYIAYNYLSPPPLSDRRYMTYDPVQKQIISPIYSMTYSAQHLATINSISINNQTVINQTRLLGKADVNLFVFNAAIDFNETEIRGYTTGYIDGPIRTIKHFVAYINIAPGINSPLLNIDHVFYPYHTEVGLPVIKDVLVKNMALTVDAHYPNTESCQQTGPDLRVLKESNPSEAPPHPMTEHNPAAVSLDCPHYSILTMLAIPDELAGTVQASAYVHEQKETNSSLQEAAPVAGFYLKTEDNFPRGQYLTKLISLFVFSPERDKIRQHIASITGADVLLSSRPRSIDTGAKPRPLALRDY